MPTVEIEDINPRYRAVCPACLLHDQVNLPMDLYQVSQEPVLPHRQIYPTHAYVATVLVCGTCKTTVPVQFIELREAKEARIATSQACEDYEGVCKHCQRPPDEHQI